MMELVIFDTATRRVYCEDLHEVLASPVGTVVRYDYREKWIEEQSVAGLVTGATVYLVYCALPNFHRSIGPEFYWGSDEVPAGTRFVGTRLAKIRTLKLEGGVWHLDLKLAGWLEFPAAELSRRVEMLRSRPGKHFVVEATGDWSDIRLSSAGTRDAWVKVIDQLQTPTSQFKEDVFWRMDVADRGSGTNINIDDDGEFPAKRGSILVLTFASHVGREVAASLAWDSRSVIVRTESAASPLRILGKAERTLRRSGEQKFEVAIEMSPELRKRTEVLRASTEVDGAIGSVVTLRISVREDVTRLSGAIFLMVCVAILVPVAANLIKGDHWGYGAFCAAVAYVLGIWASKVRPLNTKV